MTEPEDFDEEVTDNGCGCSTCEKGDECPCKLSAKEIIGREMLNNELSLSEIPMGLDKLIRDRYGSGYVTDVYKAHVVYKQNDHYYSVPYSVDKQDNINLTGSTTKVRRKVQYMPVTNVLNAVDLLSRENRPLPSARSLLLNHPTGHNEKAHGRGGGGGGGSGGSSGGGGGSSGGKATSVKSVKQLPKAGTPFKVGKSNYVEVTGSARSNKKIQRFVTSGGNAVKRGKAAPLKMKAADNAFSLERGQKVFRKVD